LIAEWIRWIGYFCGTTVIVWGFWQWSHSIAAIFFGTLLIFVIWLGRAK
jgi:hypothetical protein